MSNGGECRRLATMGGPLVQRLAATDGPLVYRLRAALAAPQPEFIAEDPAMRTLLDVAARAARTPVLSGLFALLMWAIFLASGGHHLLIRTLVESYAAMPSAGALFEPERLSAIAGWGGFALASGLIAALPMGVALLLVNVAIAIAARSAPQLNLFSVGFPLMLLVGLAGLPLALPALADSLSGALAASQDRLAGLLLG